MSRANDLIDAKEGKRQFKMGPGVVSEAATLVEKILATVVEGEVSREQWMWEKFLVHTDVRVQFEAFRLMLSYKYGKPTEKKDINISGQTYVAEVPAKASEGEWSRRYAPVKKVADQ